MSAGVSVVKIVVLAVRLIAVCTFNASWAEAHFALRRLVSICLPSGQQNQHEGTY